ncbi:hypothetical protein JFL47_03085 [Haemophilus haemoglobinophilus]|nr:hypothetical protein [Canicola haemoglobinophilus]
MKKFLLFGLIAVAVSACDSAPEVSIKMPKSCREMITVYADSSADFQKYHLKSLGDEISAAIRIDRKDPMESYNKWRSRLEETLAKKVKGMNQKDAQRYIDDIQEELEYKCEERVNFFLTK